MKKDTYFKVSNATLAKDACACPHYKSTHTVKNGFKTSLLQFLPFQEYPIHISLKKQRFLSRNYKRSFLLETSLVKK